MTCAATPLPLRRNQFLRDFSQDAGSGRPAGRLLVEPAVGRLPTDRVKSLQEPLPEEVASLLREALEADEALRRGL